MPTAKRENTTQKATQTTLKERNTDTVFHIPLILHEAERMRSESREKRFVAIIITLIIVISVNNFAWIAFTCLKLGSSSDTVGNTDSIVVHGGDITLGNLN